MAAVLLFGYAISPSIMLGAFITNVVVFLQDQEAGFATIVREKW